MKYEIVYNGVAYVVTVELKSKKQAELAEANRPSVIPIIIVFREGKELNPGEVWAH